MSLDVEVKLAIYRHFAETGAAPRCEEIAERVGLTIGEATQAYQRLRTQRVLALEPDGVSIRMAPPFSGVATQHVVQTETQRYFANCAWDALGIPAALHQRATVYSRCEQSMEPLRLEVGLEGPARTNWVFHCLVPAAHWWDDIVFT
jgi:hypothetical protein